MTIVHFLTKKKEGGKPLCIQSRTAELIIQGGFIVQTHGRIRCLTLLMILTGFILAGCGSRRWSPTDPRLETPDTANLVIDDTWSINIETEIN